MFFNKRKSPEPLGSKSEHAKMEQDGTINVNVIVSNPGFSHITERIFGHLDHKSQLQSRLVSQSWKDHVDQPHFWLKKLDKKGQSTANSGLYSGQYGD